MKAFLNVLVFVGFFLFFVGIDIPQAIASGKFIKDDSSGGDCASIGNWNPSIKTCSLNQDLTETITISKDNIVLDGAGHKITGHGEGFGVYVGGNSVIIKNVNISGFSSGISASYKSNITIESSTIENNEYEGVQLYNTGSVKIIGNTIKSNTSSGINQVLGGNHFFENNVIFSNGYAGIKSSNVIGNTLIGNHIKDNSKYGLYVSYNKTLTLKNNEFSHNAVSNLFLERLREGNNIDTSNIVEGKPILYREGAVNEEFGNETNVGSFYCVNCSHIILKDITLSESGAQIYFGKTNDSSVENVVSPDNSIGVYLNDSNGNTIKNSNLGTIFIDYNSTNNNVYNNNFWDTNNPADVNSDGNIFNMDSSIGGNYWKKKTICKDNNGDGFCDSWFTVSLAYDLYDKYPLVKPYSLGCRESCFSNVLFLPGHQASRLYKKDGDDEDQLWEPTNHNEDVKQLYMNLDGESIDSGIYTREVVDEVYGLADNVYKGFINSMNQFVAGGFINEWKPIPYDWRLPLEKIAEDGVELENGGHLDIINEIKRMATASKTGKITLIGHSNGGLLAKTLIDKLKESGNEKLIDRLIMVGTPQLGTPKAMAALLHGDETSLLHGLILDKKTGRGFAENMESAYNLLPFQKYFDTVQSPVVEFDADVKEIYDFRSLYGNNIDNWSEFKKFLLGDDGARLDPEFGDMDSPNVLREALLNKADGTHNKLDNWQSPEGMKVVQIAGWGLDTIRGIKYDDCDFIFCPDKLSNLDRSLIMTVDGDETVVVPSAVEMGGNAERYYLNIREHNKELILNLRRNRDHASILEIESLQNFIKNIIKGDKTLTEYLSKEKPEVEDEDKRLRFRLHSPVSIDLYDEDERHTGLVKNNDSDLRLYEEQIPNSYYIEFGETKYAGSGDSPVNIILTGENLGTFTFEIDQVVGETMVQSIAFANIPVMKDMRATLSVSETVSEMKIDVDGDGQMDATFQPGEEIKKEDLLGIFEKIINSLDIDETVKDRLINKIDSAKKQMEKGHSVAANAMLENVKQQVEVFSREQMPEKFRIAKDEAEKLTGIIDKIQAIE